jgi:hypothetical protein
MKMTTSTDSPFEMSPEIVIAAADAALAVARMKGIPLPQTGPLHQAFQVGFAEGSIWALERIREMTNSQPAKKE